MRAVLLMLALAPVLAACGGPVPVEQAEERCLNDLRFGGDSGTRVAVGMGGGGRHLGGFGSISWDVGRDPLAGARSPDTAFDDCVRNRSGQSPTRPLSEQPGWWGRG